MAEKVERKLAANQSADVVDYRRLMGQDQVGTLARLRALRKELIEPRIASRNGGIVKLMGDGAPVEYLSAVEAFQCALEVQQAVAERNDRLPEAERMEFRVGINLGEVIVEGEDIYGNGVNVAVRLQEVRQV